VNFRIPDTFTASLARLTGEEQKAFKTTAFDLQMNPANPGTSFHELDKGSGQELLVGARQQRHPRRRFRQCLPAQVDSQVPPRRSGRRRTAGLITLNIIC